MLTSFRLRLLLAGGLGTAAADPGTPLRVLRSGPSQNAAPDRGHYRDLRPAGGRVAGPHGGSPADPRHPARGGWPRRMAGPGHAQIPALGPAGDRAPPTGSRSPTASRPWTGAGSPAPTPSPSGSADPGCSPACPWGRTGTPGSSPPRRRSSSCSMRPWSPRVLDRAVYLELDKRCSPRRRVVRLRAGSQRAVTEQGPPGVPRGRRAGIATGRRTRSAGSSGWCRSASCRAAAPGIWWSRRRWMSGVATRCSAGRSPRMARSSSQGGVRLGPGSLPHRPARRHVLDPGQGRRDPAAPPADARGAVHRQRQRRRARPVVAGSRARAAHLVRRRGRQRPARRLRPATHREPGRHRADLGLCAGDRLRLGPRDRGAEGAAHPRGHPRQRRYPRGAGRAGARLARARADGAERVAVGRAVAGAPAAGAAPAGPGRGDHRPGRDLRRAAPRTGGRRPGRHAVRGAGDQPGIRQRGPAEPPHCIAAGDRPRRARADRRQRWRRMGHRRERRPPPRRRDGHTARSHRGGARCGQERSGRRRPVQPHPPAAAKGRRGRGLQPPRGVRRGGARRRPHARPAQPATIPT